MVKTNAQKEREHREQKKLNDPKFLEKEHKRQKSLLRKAIEPVQKTIERKKD